MAITESERQRFEEDRLAQLRIDQLEAAIRRHRDERGDDRCYQDDRDLYEVLPEGYTPRAEDTAVTIENCQKYIACRHDPATKYVSPQEKIDELQAKLDTWIKVFALLPLSVQDEITDLSAKVEGKQ